MSTVKKRRLRAILLSLTGTPAPKRHKSGLRRYLSLLGPYTLPLLAGEGRVVGYLPASPTVTGNSLTSPARTTLTVWVAPTLILRSPEYRSSRLLVAVPSSATRVTPCISPALSAGLCGSTATIRTPPSWVTPPLTASGNGASSVPISRYGR